MVGGGGTQYDKSKSKLGIGISVAYNLLTHAIVSSIMDESDSNDIWALNQGVLDHEAHNLGFIGPLHLELEPHIDFWDKNNTTTPDLSGFAYQQKRKRNQL